MIEIAVYIFVIIWLLIVAAVLFTIKDRVTDTYSKDEYVPRLRDLFDKE